MESQSLLHSASPESDPPADTMEDESQAEDSSSVPQPMPTRDEGLGLSQNQVRKKLRNLWSPGSYACVPSRV